jgi:hypothetical protein
MRILLARKVLEKFTPPQLARQWGISPDKVLAWIRSGELRAVKISTNRGSRPRYLIDAKEIEAFEARRSAQRLRSGDPPQPPVRGLLDSTTAPLIA